MQTRAKRRRLRRLLITQVFSPEARQAILRNLLSFAPPRSLASLEAAAPLFGRPVPAPLTLLAAAERGHLDVLRWAKARGAPWDARVVIMGARGGHEEAHLEVLTWVRAETKCRYDDTICRAAAAAGARYVVDGMRDRCGCLCDVHREE